MSTPRRKTVRPRSGKTRRAITVQIHPEKHQELLEWLDLQESVQATILNALYAKMYSEGQEDTLADTKPMTVPELEADPTLFKELYDALIEHMDQQHREMRAMMRDLRESRADNTTAAAPGELKPELRAAMRSAMKPGKTI